ncbi:4Fe-4S binding protein [Planctomycetota bacterium]
MAKIKSLAQKLIPWRIWVQISFLAVWLDPLALRYHNICSPVFHCYSCPLATLACPIGIMHQFAALHMFPFVTVGIIVAVGVILGGFICGWVCPIGLLQDLFSRISIRKFKLPPWVSHLRYVTLFGLVLLIPYLYGTTHFLAICQVCPIGALESSLPRKIATPLLTGETIDWTGALAFKMILLAVFIGAMVFTHRPWCRICPLGLILGWFNRFSAVFLGFKPESCTHCELCHKSCDLVAQPEKTSSTTNCICCLECTKCPPQALTLGSIFNKKTLP